MGREEVGEGLPRHEARGQSHGEKETVSLGGPIRLASFALRDGTVPSVRAPLSPRESLC